MAVHFCPQCGKKAEDSYIFCINCGVKLPREETDTDTLTTSSPLDPPQAGVNKQPTGRFTRKSSTCLPKVEPSQPEPQSPACVGKQEVKEALEKSPTRKRGGSVSGQGSPRATAAKQVKVEPLPEQEILTDNNNAKWQLASIITSGLNGLLYEVHGAASPQKKPHCILKLGEKDGKIYHEQNFFQRAAKKVTVDSWKKSHARPFLGIPTCIGFGLHHNYRFLVFSALGKNLQATINEKKVLPEKSIYQIAYRMIDCLEYVHEKEYVHGNITAENIFVNTGDLTQVYLAGYYFAFRYRPAGRHVEYRDGSRTPHQGTLEYIGLDLHKGAGPSRRSDLESLGYCMLKWLCGSLPWSEAANADETMNQKKLFKTELQSTLKECFKKKRVPDVLNKYFEYVMNLGYDEAPGYDKLRDYFSAALGKVDPYDAVDI
uniref:Protein kinase domain-containing protein n=1 Tax=Leptobrachium leishanense TaxID=445787 RepID=A0A8C5WL56_9ANUR